MSDSKRDDDKKKSDNNGKNEKGSKAKNPTGLPILPSRRKRKIKTPKSWLESPESFTKIEPESDKPDGKNAKESIAGSSGMPILPSRRKQKIKTPESVFDLPESFIETLPESEKPEYSTAPLISSIKERADKRALSKRLAKGDDIGTEGYAEFGESQQQGINNLKESPKNNDLPQSSSGQIVLKKPKRSKSPEQILVQPKKYIKMIGGPMSDEFDEELMGRDSGSIDKGFTKQIKSRTAGGFNSFDKTGTNFPIESTSQIPQYRRAEVYKPNRQTPNLNIKTNKRASYVYSEVNDYQWTLPEPIPIPPRQIPPSIPRYRSPSPPPPLVVRPAPSRSPPPPPPPRHNPPPLPTTPAEDHEFNPPAEEKDLKAQEYDDKISELNKKSAWAQKPLTKWVQNVLVKTSQRAMYEENTQQVQEGLKVIETITESPLSKHWQRLTTAIPYIIFSIGVLSSIVDLIVSDAFNPEASVTCFMFDVIEVASLTLNFLLHKSKWYTSKTDEEKENFDKKHQLMENVLAEVLLYPAIICSVITLSTDRPFLLVNLINLEYDGHKGRLELFLITFNVGSVIYIYATRIYIVNKIMGNIREILQDDDSSSYFDITFRIVYAFVLNAFLFVAMTIMLGLQIYHDYDNKPDWFTRTYEAPLNTSDLVYLSPTAAYMVMSTVIVPILSLIVFCLANYYYILELMIKINIQVIKNQEIRDSLAKHGEIAEGMMGFAKKNVHATPGRLRDIQTLTRFQRMFFVLREWWMDLIFFIWACILVLYAYMFYRYVSVENFSEYSFYAYVSCFIICVALFLCANYQSFIVVFITNIVIVPLMLAMAAQALVDKVKSLKDKAIQVLQSENSDQSHNEGQQQSSEKYLRNPDDNIGVGEKKFVEISMSSLPGSVHNDS